MQRAWNTLVEFAPHHNEINDFSMFFKFMKNIEREEPFHVARYNDGEWAFMLKISPFFRRWIVNNGHNKSEILKVSESLLNIVTSVPPYYIGIDSTTLALKGIIHSHKKRFIDLMIKFPLIIYGDIFNTATVKFGIEALLKPLRTRKVITVGPDYMEKLNIESTHIETLLNNCWRNEEEVKIKLEEEIEKSDNPVILYSCSFLAKILVDHCYLKYGDSITQLDVGSSIDPWCGVRSRPWHDDILLSQGINPQTKTIARNRKNFEEECRKAKK